MYSSEYVDDEPWQCAYCHVISSNLQNARRHKASKHPEKFKPTEQKNVYSCQLCKYRTTRSDNFKRHRETHGTGRNKSEVLYIPSNIHIFIIYRRCSRTRCYSSTFDDLHRCTSSEIRYSPTTHTEHG